MPTLTGRSRLLLLLAALHVAGCGAETYRSRLNETAQYFTYREKLARELGSIWSVGGVTYQPPRQFQPIIPPPPPAELEEGAEAAATTDAEDPRQPHYLGIELPGLLGAWEATVRADRAGAEEEQKAFLYVLGNHSRYLTPPDDTGFSQPPAEYMTDIENLITSTIGVVLPPGETGTGVEKNQRHRETAPRVEPNSKFTPRKDFTAVTLSPQIDVGNLELPFEMQLYEWGGKQIQVIVLMVYPQSISPQESLQERLLLSLETLDIADAAPTAAAAAGSAPGTDGGGGRPAGF